MRRAARLLLLAILCLAVCAPASAQRRRSSRGSVPVRGYYRKDGTYVRPHRRSRPDGNFWNNWSTKGNVNPFTGKAGTKTAPPAGYGRSRSRSMGSGGTEDPDDLLRSLFEPSLAERAAPPLPPITPTRSRDVKGTTTLDYRYQDFSGRNWRGEDLTDALFVQSTLDRADLSGAKLLRADARQALLNGTKLEGTILEGADLRDAILAGAQASRARMRNVKLDRAALLRADLRDADLSNASFDGAWIYDADLRGATLAGATFRGTFYNAATKWPEGFDPAKHGMTLAGSSPAPAQK